MGRLSDWGEKGISILELGSSCNSMRTSLLIRGFIEKCYCVSVNGTFIICIERSSGKIVIHQSKKEGIVLEIKYSIIYRC